MRQYADEDLLRELPPEDHADAIELMKSLVMRGKQSGLTPENALARGLGNLKQLSRAGLGYRRLEQLPEGALFWAERLAGSRAVRERVQKCRRKLFGSADVPFSDWDQAREWLRHHPSSAINVEEICEITGWSGWGAIEHVLIDALPVERGPQILNTSGSSEIGCHYVRVQLRPWQINKKSFEALLKQLEKYRVSLDPQSSLTAQQARLLDLMQEVGGPPAGKWKGPRGARTKYWSTLSKEYRRVYRERIKPDTLRKLWEEIMRRTPTLLSFATPPPSQGPWARLNNRKAI